MKSTRRTQPYRKGLSRPAGATLSAMLRGRTSRGTNPQDAPRKLKKMAYARARRRR